MNTAAWKRIITIALTMAMAVSGLAGVTPVAAAKKVASTVDAYDAYTPRYCAQIFESTKMSVSVKDDKITVDEEDGGIFIKAKASDIEQGEVSFTQLFDFGNIKPGFVIVNALCERKKASTVSIYLDDETTPIGTISVPKQRGKDHWDFIKNNSVNISGKNITGKHLVRLKFHYDNMSAEEKDKKTEILLRSVVFSAFDIPTVSVNIDESEGSIAEMNNDSAHNTECYGNITIQTPAGYVSEYGGKDCSGTYELEYIRGRGNSTWGPSKRPYRVKLDKKADFFGMGADKNWVLLANYYDYTLLRNKYTYWLGEQMGMEFTPQCVFVNLVMNGEYLGSYYLCEHIRVGKSRINIDDLEEEPEAVTGSAVTGGYLLSMGYEDGEYRNITTPLGVQFLLERPDFGDNKPVPLQYDYIANYMQKTEDALFGKDFKDENGVPYTDYMDLQSAVDYYLMQEFSMNGDGYLGGSTYLYKKRDGKLYWGPLWDFDYVAWGATEFSRNSVDGFTRTDHTWIAQMLKDKTFKAKLLERWKVLKPILEQSIAPGGRLDQLSEMQYRSQKANYAVAATVSDQDFSYDPENGEMFNVNYDSELERFRSWIAGRIEWVDANIGGDTKAKGTYVTFKVGKKVYAKVKVSNGYLEPEMFPDDPKKKGYKFKGWFAKENGVEYQVTVQGLTSNLTVYARFVKKDAVKGGNKIFFLQSDYYYPTDEGCSCYIPYGSYPDPVPEGKIKWSCDSKHVGVESGALYYDYGFTGTVTVKAKYKKQTIKCKVHISNWEELKDLRKVSFEKKKITMTKGTYKTLKIKLTPKSVNANSINGGIRYYAQNPKVIDVDENGVIHALKKGKTVVVAAFDGQMVFCNVTVKKKKSTKKKNAKKK